MYDVPTVLESYLSEFAAPGVTIVDGPVVTQCNGFGHGPHCFMEAEGLTVCSKCAIKFCRFCVDNVGNSNYCCIECQRLEILGILPDANEDEMRSVLRESGQQLPSNTTYGQLIEL